MFIITVHKGSEIMSSFTTTGLLIIVFPLHMTNLYGGVFLNLQSSGFYELIICKGNMMHIKLNQLDINHIPFTNGIESLINKF